jgi:DNA-binding response OmpR family regulator
MTGKTVLIIDNEVFILKKAQNILEEDNLSVKTATDLNKAKAYLLSGGLQLIIFSCSAVDNKVENFLQTVWSFEHLKDVPVMVMLSEEEVKKAVALLKMGISDYIIKPFRPKELTYRVATALSKQREAAFAAAPLSYKFDLKDLNLIELIKICEINNFSGAIKIIDSNSEYLIELRLGNITSINASNAKQNEVWDKVLSLQQGALEIVQEALSFWRANKSSLEPLQDFSSKLSSSFSDEENNSSTAVTESKRLPMGRISSLKLEERQFQIQTEVHTGNNPSITTLIICEGQILKKIERKWKPQSNDAENVTMEQDMINEHHDTIVISLQKLWPLISNRHELTEDLLLKVVKLISSFGRRAVGRNICFYYLKTAQAYLKEDYPDLSAFTINEDGKISLAHFDDAKEQHMVKGVYHWLNTFINKCYQLLPLVKAKEIRELTKPFEFRLDWIDFYPPLNKN